MSTLASDTWLTRPELVDRLGHDLESEHRGRNGFNEAFLRLYHNVPDLPPEATREAGVAVILAQKGIERRGYNLMLELCDASASQVCLETTAKVVPVGGDWEVTRNCRTMNRLLDGVNAHVKAFAVMRRAYRDCQKCDVGAVRAGIDPTGELFVERLNPRWLFWPLDGGDDPRTLVYVDSIPKSTLMAMYPKQADAIRHLGTWRRPRLVGVDKGTGNLSQDTETVRVTWACAKKVGEEVGRFTMVAGPVVLENKPWPYKKHPVVIFRWDWADEGFGGKPLAEVLEPYHTRLKGNVKTYDECLKGARPVIMVNETCNADAKFSNVPFAKIVYPDGQTPPDIKVMQTVPPDVTQAMERDYVKAAAEAGVSQALAAGQGPAGIVSGKGLREYKAIANQRLSGQQSNWEDGWTDLGEIEVMLMNDSYQDKSIRVKAPQSDWLEEIKWVGPDQLRENQYKVQYKKATGLSSTLAGKYEDIAQLQQLGVVTPAKVARFISGDVPDIEAYADDLNAPQDLADRMISEAIYGDPDKSPPMPTAMQGPTLHTMLETATNRYQGLLARRNVPRYAKQRLRKLITMIEARLKPPPTMPAPPALAGPGVQPMGATPPGTMVPPPVAPQPLPAQPVA